MKKIFFIILIISIFTNYFIFSEESIDEWSAFKEIEISGKNKYKYFFIDKDIYRYAASDLSDLRIIDDKKSFIPYYIIEGFKEEKNENINYSSKLIKRSNEKVKDSLQINSTFDFQVFYNKNDYAVNKIKLDIESALDFSNQASLYGRNEKSEWTLLTKDTLYKIDNYTNNIILLDSIVRYKFFRIVVSDNRENIEIKKCTPELDSIEQKFSSYKEKTELEYEVKNEENISTVKIKNSSRLKLLTLNLSIPGNFNRKYELQGKDQYLISSGEIYNFTHNNINISKKNIELNYLAAKDEEIILTIYNNSNTPLKIEKIEASYITDKIIFESSENKNLKVYFGNSKASSPLYDIESFKKYIESENKDQCKLGKTVIIKGKEIKNESKNYKIIYNIIIIITSFALIFILINVLKKK